MFYLDESDKIKKEALQLKLKEYTKRAEELKAIYVSKMKSNSDETSDKSPTSSNDDDRSPTLCKNIFIICFIYIYYI
jgi:hypothetical protein